MVLVCFSSAATRACCEWALRYMWMSSPRCGGMNLLVFLGKVFRRPSLVGDILCAFEPFVDMKGRKSQPLFGTLNGNYF